MFHCPKSGGCADGGIRAGSSWRPTKAPLGQPEDVAAEADRGTGGTKPGCREDVPLHLPGHHFRSTRTVCRGGLSTPWMEDPGLSGKKGSRLGHNMTVYTCRAHLSCPHMRCLKTPPDEHTKQNPERDPEEGEGGRKRC